MTNIHQYSNNNIEQQVNPAFSAERKRILTRPIQEIQTVIETGVDTFVNPKKQDEKRKKIRNRAIAASSTVLVVGGLTMLLNPRNSGKLGKKIAEMRQKLNLKINQDKSNTLKKRFYKYWNNTLAGIEKTGNVYFNFNSSKDWAWDALCTNNNKKYPKFLTKNKTVHKIVKTLDDAWVKISKTPTEAITRWFDNISKNTVKGKYKKALKELGNLEISLKAYKDKLPLEKQYLVDNKLKEISKAKEALSEENVLIRLKKQEDIMSNLKDDFAGKLRNKKKSWFKGFWAKDILEPKKSIVEKEGNYIVNKLFGENGTKGLYDETFDIFKNHLDEKQLNSLKREMTNAKKTINKANTSECVEYFDKKRDLILGGAPTDILTQIFGIGLCGVVVTKADKEDRWSKLFTNGVPIITGLLSSLVFSAKLYAGSKALLAGAVVTGITDVVCGVINKHVFGNQDDDEKNEENTNKEKVIATEVQNA